MTLRNIVVLGSTGSIGCNTLEVLRLHRSRFRVFALSAATRYLELGRQCVEWQPHFAVMTSAPHARLLQDFLKAENCPTQVLVGAENLETIASHPDTTDVMAAIVGAAGLRSSMAAARSGKRLLLANKESLVVGGQLFVEAVANGGATLLPIDSEHSAIFQALPIDRSQWHNQIEKIVLTASGGPFRQTPVDQLRHITPEQACAHPNWVMGRKISVDSATMMNKALEVIEAKYLFGLVPEQIEVVIHPQSVIHSMVQFVDQSVLAQMGSPDMRVPIAYGLSWPHRIDSGATALNLSQMSHLSFESVFEHGHPERFPALALAWDCLNGPVGSCVVLNAANEVAVDCFLKGQLRFDQIAKVNAEALSREFSAPPPSVDAVLALDFEVRIRTNEYIQQHNRRT
jgi:1-deoxy-D-xylulose-5-phosphate reductoisomerase